MFIIEEIIIPTSATKSITPSLVKSVFVVKPIIASKANKNAVSPNIKIIEPNSNTKNIAEKVIPVKKEYSINKKPSSGVGSLLNNKLITKTNPSCISTININAIGLDIN
jgi:hypothetical protein